MTSPDPVEALHDWARSGAMWLTGEPDGPPVAADGHVATAVRQDLEAIARLLGSPWPLGIGCQVLGERAALLGLRRRGRSSCGEKSRLAEGTDGIVAFTLARPEDIELVPALVGEQVNPAACWARVAEWAGRHTTSEVQQAARELGLPCSAVDPSSRRAGVLTLRAGGQREPGDRPLVVDFTGLWAGPLCGDLLRRAGAEVVKVESATRPDGSRRGDPEFFNLVNSGKRSWMLDFDDPRQLDELHALVARADLVLEASRSRALLRLGLDAEKVVDAGTTWLSITARGRDTDAVGFGDDVAAGAGFVATSAIGPVFCGDALADPTAGVAAARAGLEALMSPRARLVDVSMHDLLARRRTGGIAPHAVVRWRGAWHVDVGTGTPAVVARPRRPGPDRPGLRDVEWSA